jgi:hypothetical protein
MQSGERLNKTKLVDFLEIVDKELSRKITLVAVGGTAMTLLDIKPSTIDVDFTGPRDDISEFEQVLKNIPHGFKLDCWKDGMIFSQILPGDYLKKSILETRMEKIELRALHPLDIVATKIGRLDERDQEDIRDCIQKFRLTKNQIAKRTKQVQYVGREANYQTNLEYVLNRFFRN